MKRTAFETYALVACVVLGIYGLMTLSGIVSMSLFLAHPDWEMTGERDAQYANNDVFCRENFSACQADGDVLNSAISYSCSDKEDCARRVQEQEKIDKQREEARKAATSSEAITKKRLEAFEAEKTVRHQKTVMVLIHGLIQGAVVAVLFGLHWRILRKSSRDVVGEKA